MLNDVIKCACRLKRVIFSNGDFSIVCMELIETLIGEIIVDNYGCFVTTGNGLASLNMKETYILTAKETKHKKFGIQYELAYISIKVDLSTIDKQKDFLKVGLPTAKVEALYETLDNPIEALENKDIELLCTVKGIAERTAELLIKRYESSKDKAEVFVKLKKYNLSNSIVLKLIDLYKNTELIISKLEENIYILADELKGVGFIKADEIAMENGIEYNDPRRISSFIRYYLNEESKKGNSYVYTEDLIDSIEKTLVNEEGKEISFEIIKSVFISLIEREIIVGFKLGECECIGLKVIYDTEMEILAQLERISNGENSLVYENWEKVVQEIEDNQGWKYTDQQKAGVKTVLENQLTLVVGLAGTGKSTVTNAMSKILTRNGYTVIQCALSGRAAQRMKELNGLESNTIHRTIKYGTNIQNNESNPLDTDVLLLDEASMPDAFIYLALLKSIKTGTKLVIIGDEGQLPSIGVANIFFDLLKYKYPIVRLTEVHRQARASAIISKSIELRHQHPIFEKDFEGRRVLGELQDLELDISIERYNLHDKIVEHFLEHYYRHNNNIVKVQIVVPMKDRGSISVKELNNSIQVRVNPNIDTQKGVLLASGLLGYVGDKVINLTNGNATTLDGDNIKIYNGNIGIITDTDPQTGKIRVHFFDLDEIVDLEKEQVCKSIDLAYAITCHKLQGSSADTVIVGVDYSAYTLLSCEWLYTAITRAEKYCVLVGERGAVNYAISKSSSTLKQTFISLVAAQRT